MGVYRMDWVLVLPGTFIFGLASDSGRWSGAIHDESSCPLDFSFLQRGSDRWALLHLGRHFVARLSDKDCGCRPHSVLPCRVQIDVHALPPLVLFRVATSYWPWYSPRALALC